MITKEKIMEESIELMWKQVSKDINVNDTKELKQILYDVHNIIFKTRQTIDLIDLFEK